MPGKVGTRPALRVRLHFLLDNQNASDLPVNDLNRLADDHARSLVGIGLGLADQFADQPGHVAFAEE